MARNPRAPIGPTKKHLARMERERIQRRNILLGSIVIVALVVLTILYGVLDQTYLRARQPVAVVNGDRITTEQFQGQVRYGRFNLIRNAQNTYQFMQLFGSDPSTQAQFVSQLQQIQNQLSPTVIGQNVLDQLVYDRLIRQEAKRRGITVTSDEVEKAFQEAFGFYAGGTPTPTPTFQPQPTSTLSPEQMTAVAPTATPITATATITASESITSTTPISPTETLTSTQGLTSTETTTSTETIPTPTGPVTPTATAAPSPTPTPYTQEGYEKLRTDTLENFKTEYGVTEADIRYVLESQVYREKVMDAILKEENIGRSEEQVWARHILSADEAKAQEIRAQLEAVINDPEKLHDAWFKLAAENSTDTSNKDKGGDLGWFGKGAMVAEFENAAFSMKVGEISQPVKTSFGYHVIQVLGHENRPLSDDAYEQLRQTKFQEWLDKQKEAGTIDIRDIWTERVPAEPTLPPEITQLITSASGGQQSLPVQQVTPQATSQP